MALYRDAVIAGMVQTTVDAKCSMAEETVSRWHGKLAVKDFTPTKSPQLPLLDPRTHFVKQ